MSAGRRVSRGPRSGSGAPPQPSGGSGGSATTWSLTKPHLYPWDLWKERRVRVPGFGARKGRPLLTARGLELGLAKTLSHRLLALQLGVGGREDMASVDLAAVPWGFPKAPAYLSGSVHWAQDSWMVWTPGRGGAALGCDDSHWHRVATEQGLICFCCFRPRSEKQALGSGAPGQKRDLGCSLFLQDQQPREGRRPRATAGSSVVRRRGSVKWQVGRRVRSRQKTAGLASHRSPNGKNKTKTKTPASPSAEHECSLAGS